MEHVVTVYVQEGGRKYDMDVTLPDEQKTATFADMSWDDVIAKMQTFVAYL